MVSIIDNLYIYIYTKGNETHNINGFFFIFADGDLSQNSHMFVWFLLLAFFFPLWDGKGICRAVKTPRR